MLTRRYYSVNGEIIGDSVAGDYMRDALGNVTGTIDRATGQVVNTYRYKPSGELLSKTGTGPDPKFTNVGVHGVRNTGLPHAESDMRARHYSTKEGRFTSVDPLWPEEPAYGYAAGNPVNNIDPSGLGCKHRVQIQLDVNRCDAKCENCICHFNLEFILNVTVFGKGCKSCKMYQWVAEKPIGSPKFDDVRGWPYSWDASGPPAWTTHDQPGVTGYGYCNQTIHDWRSFTTCIDCDGECNCWNWEIQSRMTKCSSPKCSTGGPYKRTAGEAFTKMMCTKGRKHTRT